MIISESEISPGNYDVNGIAVLNFDAGISSVISLDEVKAISKASSAIASGK